jgi:hypothetical protein
MCGCGNFKVASAPQEEAVAAGVLQEKLFLASTAFAEAQKCTHRTKMYPRILNLQETANKHYKPPSNSK